MEAFFSCAVVLKLKALVEVKESEWKTFLQPNWRDGFNHAFTAYNHYCYQKFL